MSNMAENKEKKFKRRYPYGVIATQQIKILKLQNELLQKEVEVKVRPSATSQLVKKQDELKRAYKSQILKNKAQIERLWDEIEDLSSLAVGTFESYLQDTGKWDDFKKFKELMEDNCPSGSDFEEMFSHFWGHRCSWDEELEQNEE